jgi:hypothetical protein
MNSTEDILKYLQHRVACYFEDDIDPLIVRQLANVDLCVRPTPTERLFQCNIHLAYVLGQGCCYTSHPVTIDPATVGRPASELGGAPLATRIAVLDSVYAGFNCVPTAEVKLVGSMEERSQRRAAFIVDRLCAQFSLRSGSRVAQIGVVAEFIKALQRKDVQVDAYDLDNDLIGQKIHNVVVRHGSEIERHILNTDVILITGMSLWTDTFASVVKLASASGVRVVMFAESAANLAPHLLSCGASAVFSEPFPFYVFGGNAVVRYYTSAPPITLARLIDREDT